MDSNLLHKEEFDRLRSWLHAEAGIYLSESKKAMVEGRLSRRAMALGCENLSDYLGVLEDPANASERQNTLDLLTTNETYFFREPKHFELLAEVAARRRTCPQPMRVWSAACSSGEEVYSMAAVLHHELGDRPWEVFGSDLSRRVLAVARTGVYSTARADGIPSALRKYFLKGTGPCAGQISVQRTLRQRVRFARINLNSPLPALEPFDVIFLRNVMIYFDGRTKQAVVERVTRHLRPGGLFVIGHLETLTGLTRCVQSVRPSVYVKPGASWRPPRSYG